MTYYKSSKRKSIEKEEKNCLKAQIDLHNFRNEYKGSKRAFELRQIINPNLLHKLLDWLEKTSRSCKKKYVLCNFREIVELLNISDRHARKVVKIAREKGFIKTERHGRDYYIYRMKNYERLIGFKRTVWDLYCKHKEKIKNHAPDLYMKMFYYIKNCRKKEKSEALLSLKAVDSLPLGVIEDIFKLLLSLKALFSKNNNDVFKIYGETTNFLIKMEDDNILKIGYLNHVMKKAQENIIRFVLSNKKYIKPKDYITSKRNNWDCVYKTCPCFWKFLFLICGKKSVLTFMKTLKENMSVHNNTIYYPLPEKKKDWCIRAKNSVHNFLWDIRRYGAISIKPWSFVIEVRCRVDRFIKSCKSEQSCALRGKGIRSLSDIVNSIEGTYKSDHLKIFYDYISSHDEKILKGVKPSFLKSFRDICKLGSYAIQYLESRLEFFEFIYPGVRL